MDCWYKSKATKFAVLFFYVLLIIQGPSLVQALAIWHFHPPTHHLMVCLYFEISLNYQTTHQCYHNMHSLYWQHLR